VRGAPAIASGQLASRRRLRRIGKLLGVSHSTLVRDAPRDAEKAKETGTPVVRSAPADDGMQAGEAARRQERRFAAGRASWFQHRALIQRPMATIGARRRAGKAQPGWRATPQPAGQAPRLPLRAKA
jgi:hypothetical protein